MFWIRNFWFSRNIGNRPKEIGLKNRYKNFPWKFQFRWWIFKDFGISMDKPFMTKKAFFIWAMLRTACQPFWHLFQRNKLIFISKAEFPNSVSNIVNVIVTLNFSRRWSKLALPTKMAVALGMLSWFTITFNIMETEFGNTAISI